MVENIGIKIVMLANLVLLAFDTFSTLINGPLVKHLESNPLYDYLGVSGIVVFNLGLLFIFYYAYVHYLGVTGRYTVLSILLVIALIRGIASWNNFMVYLHPPTLAQAAAVTTAQKTATVKRFVWSGILMYLPGILAYMAFKQDHFIKKKWD